MMAASRSFIRRLTLIGMATLIGGIAAGPALAQVEYTARARASQFDPFTEDVSAKRAFVGLSGFHGDPPNPYAVSGRAQGVEMEVVANVSFENIQLKTSRGIIDDLSVTFSSEINNLATAGSITVKIPFTMTYNLDVPEPPHVFSQGSAAVVYTMNGRQQPSDFLVGNDDGILSLLNSSSTHIFVNQTGAFAAITAVENADDTLTGLLELTLNDQPGDPITVELFAQTTADAGGSGAGGFAESLLLFDWDLSATSILDASDTPVANSNVTVTAIVPPAVPVVAPLGLLVLVLGLGLTGWRRSTPSPRLG